MISNSLKTGEFLFTDEDLAIFEDFVQYCNEQSLTDEADKIRECLEVVKNSEKSSPEIILKVDLLILRLLKMSADKNEVIQGYKEVISRSRERFGPLSQPVQDIYIELSKTLQYLGAKEDVLNTIQERLTELAPDYTAPLVFVNESLKARPITHRILNRVRSSKKKTHEMQTLFQSAVELYNQGKHQAAFEKHCLAAKLGNIESIFTLGTYYQLGIGCEINMADARKYYRKAGEMGHLGAQHHYAALLQTGLGGEVDLEGAVLWYENASASGHVTATMNLAYLHVSSLIGGPFYATGIATFLRAYELGNEEALTVVFQYLDALVTLVQSE